MEKHPYRSRFPSVGPATVRDLAFINIKSQEQLTKLGAEGAMKLFIDKHGGRKSTMCSCQAYQFEGIIRCCKWYEIPQFRKEQLKAYVASLRTNSQNKNNNTMKTINTNIVSEIDQIMKNFPHVKKDLGYGYRRTFDNKMWFDIIDYKRENMQILRVGRGAWLVRQYPQLAGLFDEIAKVIAKMQLPSVKTIHDKHLIGLFQILHEAPAKIGAFD